jgi:CO/xanthine dehydrogenase FAD-binding subunit
MSLPEFTYLSPKNLKEACALLIEHGDKAKILAGGTDLLIRMGHRAMRPDAVIGLRSLTDLNYINYEAGLGLRIGALARLSDVAGHAEVIKRYPALAESASQTATVQIRNMGTVVGNICNAAPSADNATPLLVHQAEVVIVKPGGERVLPLTDFFRGPGLTALEMGEIVREVRLPDPGQGSASNYQKLSARSKVDIAGVGVSAFVALDGDGVCTTVCLALAAVAPVPMRARHAEDALTGRRVSPDLLEEAGAKAADECSPISDVRSSAAYRRAMVKVLTIRALERCLEIASGKSAGCEI